MANRHGGLYIIVAVLALGLVFLGLVMTFAYQQPTDLTQTTGIVKEYRCYEEKWYDDFLGNSKGSYFSIRLEDGSYFEATGICHDLIDHSLLEDLQVGEEITLTHDPVSGGLEKIYAIEHNGKNIYPQMMFLSLLQKHENGRTSQVLSFSHRIFSIGGNVCPIIH